MSDIYKLQYSGMTLAYPGWNGYVGWSTVAPFNVVDSATWNRNYGITWGNSLTEGGVLPTAAYCTTTKQPNNSQLYRKVTCNSPVRITALQTNSNQGVTNNTLYVVTDFVPMSLNTNYGLWQSYATIYDNNLNPITINNEPLTSTTTVGNTFAYKETGDGNGYTWYIINLNCDVTLSAGDYWFPCFQRRHNKAANTHYGFYSAISGDMMALRQWNDTTNTAFPPAYYNTSSKPYLKLTDENGHEWYV